MEQEWGPCAFVGCYPPRPSPSCDNRKCLQTAHVSLGNGMTWAERALRSWRNGPWGARWGLEGRGHAGDERGRGGASGPRWHACSQPQPLPACRAWCIAGARTADVSRMATRTARGAAVRRPDSESGVREAARTGMSPQSCRAGREMFGEGAGRRRVGGSVAGVPPVFPRGPVLVEPRRTRCRD